VAENKKEEPAKKGRGAGKPFQPGVSGNPGGRPKLVGEVRELAQKYCPRAIEVLADLMENATHEATRKGAADSILDRGIGKPVQFVESEVRAEVTSPQLDTTGLTTDDLKLLRELLAKAAVRKVSEDVK
jgi:hypothetical protein